MHERSVGASLLLLGALATGAILAAKLFGTATTKRSRKRQLETVRDKTLKDSFPASDPPASQFFGIPSNRQ